MDGLTIIKSLTVLLIGMLLAVFLIIAWARDRPIYSTLDWQCTQQRVVNDTLSQRYEQHPHKVIIYREQEKIIIKDAERDATTTLHGVDASLFEDAFFSKITLTSFNELCAKYISKAETVCIIKEHADHE